MIQALAQSIELIQAKGMIPSLLTYCDSSHTQIQHALNIGLKEHSRMITNSVVKGSVVPQKFNESCLQALTPISHWWPSGKQIGRKQTKNLGANCLRWNQIKDSMRTPDRLSHVLIKHSIWHSIPLSVSISSNFLGRLFTEFWSMAVGSCDNSAARELVRWCCEIC